MRKLLAALLILSTCSIPTSAEAAVKPGSKCIAIGKTTTISKIGYTCTKVGSKKVWLQSVRVGVPCKKTAEKKVVLRKKYVCIQSGTTRKWQIEKTRIDSSTGQKESESATATVAEQSSMISIEYDSISTQNKIPVTIERVSPTNEVAGKAFKYELTSSTSFKTLIPGTYSLALGKDRVVSADGINLGNISATQVVIGNGESKTVTVNFETFLPKTTQAPESISYTEFKKLPNDGIQIASKELAVASTPVGSYLVLPATSELPSGYIGRVVKVQENSYTVEPASFLEAVPSGSISLNSNVNAADIGMQSEISVGSPTLLLIANSAGMNIEDTGKRATGSFSCASNKIAKFSLAAQPVLEYIMEIKWTESRIEKATLAVKIGAEVKFESYLKVISFKCSASLSSPDIPLGSTSLFLKIGGEVGVSVELAKPIKFVENEFAIPVYLNGGVQYVRGKGWHKYAVPDAPSVGSISPLIGTVTVTGDLTLTLKTKVGSVAEVFVTAHPDLTTTWTLEKVKCEVEVVRATKFSISVNGGILIDPPGKWLDKDFELFNKNLGEWAIGAPARNSITIPAVLCSTVPSDDELFDQQYSSIPFGGEFTVQGSGVAIDYYIRLNKEIPIYIVGTVPGGTSEGILTVYSVKNQVKTEVQRYAIGMGQHTHEFAPPSSGTYEFKLYFTKNGGGSTPDKIQVSIFPARF
jgi:hypothetical protein